MTFEGFNHLATASLDWMSVTARHAPKLMSISAICIAGFNIAQKMRKEKEPLAHQLKILTFDEDEASLKPALEILKEMSPQKRKAFLTQSAPLFTPQMSFHEKMNLFVVLSKDVKDAERQEVVQQVISLSHPQDDKDRYSLIQALARVPDHERKPLIDRVMSLFAVDATNLSKSLFIRSFSFVPETERGLLLEAVRQSVILDENQKIRIVRILTKIPSEQRRDMALLLNQIWLQELNDTNRDLILATIAHIPSLELISRVRRAILQMEFERGAAVDRGYPSERIVELLETSLDEPFAPFNLPMAHLAALGYQSIDVHHGNRDALTRRAFERLRQEQGDLPDPSRAIEAFQSYLDGVGGISETIRSLAKKAFIAPKDQDEAFGPLLGDDLFAIRGLFLTGNEVIARLWKFCESYRDPQLQADLEKEEEGRNNAKFGMVKALADSFDEEGKRVCNPGKVQRLIVAVLQGRLLGIDIDETITIAQIVNGFFADPQRRALSSPQAVLLAAQQYLTENPLIDREAFLEHIREYVEITFREDG